MSVDTSRRVVHTACTLDCPDACSLEVTVEGSGASERIVKVDAAPGNPLTQGWICAKVRRHAERVHSPERVLTPLIRVGAKGEGRFRALPWDDALAIIAGRIREAVEVAGAESVVAYTYNSSTARVEQHSATEAFFAAIGSTELVHTICAHTVGEAWTSVFGSMGSADPADVVHSDLVVVWGANPNASNVHVAELLRQAQRSGARIVVIDPRATPIAQRADLHLAVLPGTDVVLAYAIAHRWAERGGIDREFLAQHDIVGADEFLAAAAEWTLDRAAEVCGLDAADIAALADWWAASPRAMLRLGWGQERNRNGFSACRAVLALPVLGGHFPRHEGDRGRGVAQSLKAGALSGVVAKSRWPHEAFGHERRSLPMHRIGEWMAPGSSDPCRVLFVQGSNPMVMCPDTRAVRAAFERTDVFTVVHEQVLTDTALYADIVLPATTSFELDDVAWSYGARAVLPVRAAIAPVGESWSNDQVGLGVARAYGFEWQLPAVDLPSEPMMVELPTLQFVDTHRVGSPPRVHLVDPVHGAPVFTPTEVGLAVLSPSSTKMINSIFGEFADQAADVQMHPADADRYGLADGAVAELVSADGAVVTAAVRVTTTVREGVLVMPKGVWLRHHRDGLGVNALTPAWGDPVTDGACFNDARVQVRPQPSSVAAPAN
jgi:anaerobic selenocysteine-containing dehydrogenase